MADSIVLYWYKGRRTAAHHTAKFDPHPQVVMGYMRCAADQVAQLEPDPYST